MWNSKELSIKTKEAFDKWSDTLPVWSDYEIELESLESIKMDDVYEGLVAEANFA